MIQNIKRKIKKVTLIRMQPEIIKDIKHPLHICPPLTLKYVQAYLQRSSKYCVELIDLCVERLFLQEVLNNMIKDSPAVVVIFNEIFASPQSLNLASSLKKAISNIYIIGIGPDVSCRPEEYNFPDTPFNAIIPGEAEEEVFLLIERMNVSIESSLNTDAYIKREFAIIKDLDKLPIPNYSLAELQKYPFLYPLRINKRITCGYISTSRGCCHKCIFCSQKMRNSYGEKIRLKSAVKIVNEIEEKMETGVNFIYFVDDNLTSVNQHVISVCQEILKRNLKINWSAQARIDEVNSYLLKIMKLSGCKLLFYGVESGSDRINCLLNKTNNWKEWVDKSRETFKMTKKLGISTCALFIIGSPAETRGEVEKSIKLSKVLNPDMIKVHFFVPYPGSVVYSQIKDKIQKETLIKMHHYTKPLINLSNISLHELCKMQRRFYKSILLRPTFIFQHFIKYFFYYIHNFGHFFILAKGGLKVLISRYY
ncbi:MAG: radical SAM protein [Candidatus Omnitrophica bacterium]|nr:radical SAM protein [Candidatus Omnitrophota bacterium]